MKATTNQTGWAATMRQMVAISNPMVGVDSSLKMDIFNPIIWVDISPRKDIINRMAEVGTSPLMASIFSQMGWGDGTDKENTNDRHLIAIIEKSLELI